MYGSNESVPYLEVQISNTVWFFGTPVCACDLFISVLFVAGAAGGGGSRSPCCDGGGGGGRAPGGGGGGGAYGPGGCGCGSGCNAFCNVGCVVAGFCATATTVVAGFCATGTTVVTGGGVAAVIVVGIDVVSGGKLSRRIVCSFMTLSKTVYEPVFFEIFSSRVNSLGDIADSFK